MTRDPYDDPPNLPRGVFGVFKERKRGVKQEREESRSDQHIRAGEGEGVWNHLVQKVAATSVISPPAKDATIGSKPVLKFKFGNPDGDSDDDFFSFHKKVAVAIPLQSEGSASVANSANGEGQGTASGSGKASGKASGKGKSAKVKKEIAKTAKAATGAGARQKAKREVAAAEKVIAPLDLALRQLSDEACIPNLPQHNLSPFSSGFRTYCYHLGGEPLGAQGIPWDRRGT